MSRYCQSMQTLKTAGLPSPVIDLKRVARAITEGQGRPAASIAADAFALASPAAEHILAELRRVAGNANAISFSGSTLFLLHGCDTYLAIRLKLGADAKAVLAAIDAAVGHLQNHSGLDTAQTVGATLAVLSFTTCEIEIRAAKRDLDVAVSRLARAASAVRLPN